MKQEKWLYKNTKRFKGLLIILALVVIVAQVWVTQKLVVNLRIDQREIIQLNANFMTEVIQNEELSDLSFFFESIKNIKFPIILTDAKNNISNHINLGIDDQPPFEPETVKELQKALARMRLENDPIKVEYNGDVYQQIHFGDSKIIDFLNWLPLFQALLIGGYVLFAYIGFSNIKKSEQSYIWVGMAKETAHQLGTPISSLFGWIEILNDGGGDMDIKDITSAMVKDVDRLNRVANRFSQIGSVSDLEVFSLNEVAIESVDYFTKRLPQLGKSVSIDYIENVEADVKLNKNLFEWALENLIKNSIDSFENKGGKISVEVGENEEADLYLDVTDTGKGIPFHAQADIFKPGFSTKKRGWGLGLNFTRRIIEEYHHGKLELVYSQPDKGTSMRITLDPIKKTS